MNLSELQIVILEDLKSLWEKKEIREFYNEILSLKFDGYSGVYGDNVISTDKIDFFGTHLVVCKKGLKLKPIFSFKSVTLEKCETFNTVFPAINLIAKDGDKRCLWELEKIVNKAKKHGRSISFEYSWAQDPDEKELRTKEQAQLYRDLVMMMVYQYHTENNISEMIACGAPKVKTVQFLEQMGMKKIGPHSKFLQKDLNNTEAYILHLTEFSEYAKEMAKKYSAMWDERLILSSKEKLKIVDEVS